MKSTCPLPCRTWLILTILAVSPLAVASTLELSSPSQVLTAEISSTPGGLQWMLRRGEQVLVENSRLGLTVQGTDLGSSGSWARPSVKEIRETYPWRGVKATATNHCLAYSIPIHHTPSNIDWVLEAKVFDDGFAYRYRIPGSGERLIRGESSSWTLPPDSRLWYQPDTRNYEGAYQSAAPSDVPVQTTEDSPRPVHMGAPATAELPDGSCLLITEADLVNYSGISLKPTGTRRIEVAFQDDPDGFSVEGEILSPWRVTVAARNLNALVNTDVIHNLATPPDPSLFPDGARTDWIQPGRALITWCVFGNDGAQWHLQKWFVDQCAALRCEYLLVDGGWLTERWGYLSGGADPWKRMAEICDYASTRNVGIVVWHAYPEGRDDGPGLTDPEARREFFRRCRESGVKGVKIDFFDSESYAMMAAYEDLARLAAENRLLINFHGANKPTGEVRTWPNEITREGIREQEYLLWEQLPLEHYSALPFTRMVVGHSDFLPTYVRRQYLKNTTATFQMATAVIATTSFICWPDHPDHYLASPFLGLIQNIPLLWEETIVLPGSKIGQQTAFARRAGDSWYVGVLNSADREHAWSAKLDFLDDIEYTATVYSDAKPHPTGVKVETGITLARGSALEATLGAGGGFVAWIKPLQKP